MYMKPIVELDIAKIIDKFKQKCWNKVKTEIMKPLTQVFNYHYHRVLFQKKLKVAKALPIGRFCLILNYRPSVSLLPCFSKILERLVFNRCIDYINHHEIHNDKQFGFRPKHSTYMAIAQLVDQVANAVEKQQLAYS